MSGKIAAILTVFVTSPIWFYLVWWMLEASGAGELQMFLFWVYVPFTALVLILRQIALSEKSES